jgi:hypothetical protein
MFPAWHITLTALATAVLTAGATAGWLATRRSGRRPLALGDLIGVGIAAGLGVLLWRFAANVPTLNDDPIPGVSPADVLSASLAYVAASVYLQLRGGPGRLDLDVAPAAAAVVALVVDIVTI